MKKLLFGSFLILLAGSAFSQSLEKGNLVGQHVGVMVLNPDVTYNQYKAFYLTKYLPEFNKLFGGELKAYLAEGERGSEKSSITVLYVFKSVAVRDKFFPKDQPTEAFTTAMDKIKSLSDQLDKMGTYSEKFYTDWVVQ